MERCTLTDNTKCVPHLVLTQWIPYFKINLQLEGHFLLSAAGEVSPSRLLLLVVVLANESLVRRLTLTAPLFKSLCQNIAPGEIWADSCPQEQFHHGDVFSPLLWLPAGYMSKWRATFNLTLVNNREGMHAYVFNIQGERESTKFNHMLNPQPSQYWILISQDTIWRQIKHDN